LSETIKGINIKLSLDGRGLENELKEINKDLKEQQKDLRAINANLKYDSSNTELLRKKQIQLNEVLNATKKRLDTQNKALEKAKEGIKLGTVSQEEFRKMQRNVSYSEADVKRLNNELEKTKGKIKDLGNVKFDNIAKVGSTLTKSLTMPILGAVTALTALATKSASTSKEIDDTAKKLGISMEALQEWNHVAKISGSSTQSLENAFIKVNALLGDIALGDVKQFALAQGLE
jgi:phage-related minor tail protein